MTSARRSVGRNSVGAAKNLRSVGRYSILRRDGRAINFDDERSAPALNLIGLARRGMYDLRSVAKPQLVAALLPACSTTPGPDRGSGASRNSDHPLGTGSVEFVGFSPEELQEFRVIPEDGGELFTPRAGIRIADVDGFWWSGNRDFWFKIPDHCHSTTSKAPNSLVSSHECSQLGIRVQKLRGQPTKPGWHPDSGNTAHPSDYPF